MRNRIKVFALVLFSAVSLVSCGKMKEGKCVCTTSSTIGSAHFDLKVDEYPDLSEEDCMQIGGTSTGSNGITLVIKCDYQ